MLAGVGNGTDRFVKNEYGVTTTAAGNAPEIEAESHLHLPRKHDLAPILFIERSVLGVSLVLISFFVSVLHAQSLNDQIRRAAELNDQGNFTETLKLLAPVLQSQRQSDDPVVGVAWNINGSALQSTGDEEGARRSYERAIEILGRTPAERQNLATALDNLGTLKAQLGQLSEAESLEVRSRETYEAAGDPSGVARTSVNLALFALGQGRRRKMRRLLEDAFSAEAEVAAPEAGDLSALYNAQALELNTLGDPKGALASIDRAIQLLIDHYGPRYYMLASGYALRGQLEAKLNDRDQALTAYKNSIEILTLHGDLNSRVYFLVEAAYAKALRQFGAREDAEQMERAARSGLDSLRNPCSGCTVSADSFR
jgi:tetratricopeptide (TPR) repeat protein